MADAAAGRDAGEAAAAAAAGAEKDATLADVKGENIEGGPAGADAVTTGGEGNAAEAADTALGRCEGAARENGGLAREDSEGSRGKGDAADDTEDVKLGPGGDLSPLSRRANLPPDRMVPFCRANASAS